ncbi:hypothetical protein V5O48_017211 [Marasmius crinis-equi]|uniref:Uncharacterized protein n=1 Tax=Marasmius crinis-equi TaxID=585013 RepID=A0ABR3EPL1_9AGAR
MSAVRTTRTRTLNNNEEPQNRRSSSPESPPYHMHHPSSGWSSGHRNRRSASADSQPQTIPITHRFGHFSTPGQRLDEESDIDEPSVYPTNPMSPPRRLQVSPLPPSSPPSSPRLPSISSTPEPQDEPQVMQDVTNTSPPPRVIPPSPSPPEDNIEAIQRARLRQLYLGSTSSTLIPYPTPVAAPQSCPPSPAPSSPQSGLQRSPMSRSGVIMQRTVS